MLAQVRARLDGRIAAEVLAELDAQAAEWTPAAMAAAGQSGVGLR